MSNSIRHVNASRGQHVVIHRRVRRHRSHLPERHDLADIPVKPDASLSWLWIVLGGALVALIITFPVILVVAGAGAAIVIACVACN